MTKVFIDGSAGTTGLQIYDRMSLRKDILLIALSEELRKEVSARKDAINEADVAFLCLPDDAARESVSLVENSHTAIIDTSTAHRTDDAWAYGFPELSPEHRGKIENSKRIANPGCHASGFIASVYPLVSAGVIEKDAVICSYSLTGYSGGGKKLIAEYEDENRNILYDSTRIYGTNLKHKHIPEMVKVCGLEKPPVFSPIVGDYLKGMATTVLLQDVSAEKVWQCLSDHYSKSRLVTVAPLGGDDSVIYSNLMAGKDSMRLWVCGHDGQTMVTAVFDNLGKGASGAAIQNMNIILGLDEATGLNV